MSREMLELAAKAAEIKLADEVDSYIPGSRAMWVVGPGGRDAVWNPLNDDGDAMRLGARLGLHLHYHKSHGETRALVRAELGDVYAIEFYVGDAFTATRRAIVRAAAVIGKDMP